MRIGLKEVAIRSEELFSAHIPRAGPSYHLGQEHVLRVGEELGVL